MLSQPNFTFSKAVPLEYHHEILHTRYFINNTVIEVNVLKHEHSVNLIINMK